LKDYEKDHLFQNKKISYIHVLYVDEEESKRLLGKGSERQLHSGGLGTISYSRELTILMVYDVEPILDTCCSCPTPPSSPIRMCVTSDIYNVL
jgi:hypothetical protein